VLFHAFSCGKKRIKQAARQALLKYTIKRAAKNQNSVKNGKKQTLSSKKESQWKKASIVHKSVTGGG
jgi:hypothetical protein